MSPAEANGNCARPGFTAGAGPVIRVTDLHKYYDLGETRVHALRGVSLEIRAGEFVAIMGGRAAAASPPS